MSEVSETSEAAMKEAGLWLLDKHVRSFSPQTSTMLLEIGREIQDKLELAPPADPDAKQYLTEYAACLRLVSSFAGMHQGLVIAKLGALIDRSKHG